MSARVSPRQRTTLSHYPALDGLRGIAVAAVLLFHGGNLVGAPGRTVPSLLQNGLSTFLYYYYYYYYYNNWHQIATHTLSRHAGGRGRVRFKTAVIAAHLRADPRRFAWADDDLYRTTPPRHVRDLGLAHLLIRPRRQAGLTDQHIDELISFAAPQR